MASSDGGEVRLAVIEDVRQGFVCMSTSSASLVVAAKALGSIQRHTVKPSAMDKTPFREAGVVSIAHEVV
jgi:hypothetical protein